VTWAQIDTGTDACLFSLAFADGAVWVVGDQGFAARVIDERVETIDLATSSRLVALYAMPARAGRSSEVVALGFDGMLHRWCDGVVTAIATGSTTSLTALTTSKLGTWIVVGDGGFIARSPDGRWFSRVKSEIQSDRGVSRWHAGDRRRPWRHPVVDG
jgi:hypothetical protein